MGASEQHNNADQTETDEISARQKKTNDLKHQKIEKLKKFIEYSSNLFAFFVYAHIIQRQVQKLLNLNTLLCTFLDGIL